MAIELRGVRVHNLKGVDVDIPLNALTVILGVSGAGKSSLAFDTLYAESQRRYVQSFSAYTRQFLERFEPPAADRIGFLPPAVAIRRTPGSPRATVGTITETAHDLQLLFARMGTVVCPACGVEVLRWTPDSVAAELERLPNGTRLQVAFEWSVSTTLDAAFELLRHAGFSRVIAGGETLDLHALLPAKNTAARPTEPLLVIADRLIAGRTEASRIRESLETAFAHGGGESLVSGLPDVEGFSRFSTDYRCAGCGRTFPAPEPSLFNHQSALGACPECRGTGQVRTRGRESQTCPACGGTRLQPDALAVRLNGMCFVEWGGLTVEECRRRISNFKSHISDGGAETSSASEIANLKSEISNLRFQSTAQDISVERSVLVRLHSRLDLLHDLGLGYLTLDRSASTLSTGESRRVHLAAALSTGLVNTLSVLEEPTAGLHPTEIPRVIDVIRKLRDAGNTIVAVEHAPEVIAAADYALELGPGAGPEGGTVVRSGAGVEFTPTELPRRVPEPRPPAGHIELRGVTHRNLVQVDVAFPLGVLCVVEGVSGSGKTSLVCDALHAAVIGKLRSAEPSPLVRSVSGSEALTDVVLIDQRPVSKTVRSTPGTMLGVLAPIRQLFAQAPDAQARNYGALHFSFNAASGGRCPVCEGRGELEIDLQFLPDVRTVCPECHGTRFRREVLDIRYRGLTIAEVLAMNAREAFPFFRGLPQLQKRLKSLKDVGLDYLPLGRSAATLSSGELQRLKLAACLRRGTRSRTLFLLDEPTTGLHARDVARLLEVFDLLLGAGHSVVVIAHHPAVIAAADYRIQLGPGAGRDGGRVVSAGARQAEPT